MNEEVNFHNKLFKDKQYSLKPRNSAYAVVDNAFDYYRDQIIKSKPQFLLELACSTGLWCSYFSKLGIKVCAIDISFEAARLCSQRKQELNVIVGDIQSLPLDLNSFDCVIGSGIIHHLESNMLFDSLAKSNVQCSIFIEPLKHNPLINLYRFLTPNSRTKGETPLSMNQLNFVQSKFPSSTFRYFGFTSLILTPFVKIPLLNKLIKAFQIMDDFLLSKIPILQKYAWIVVMNVQKTPQECS
ncbi:MAG: methyltransferase domain-containing protein [Candidatus Cloacimonetes bacterium]|nr:methyltransferase domain-containing protein [Candidatus Cloacimonadota bacterium]